MKPKIVIFHWFHIHTWSYRIWPWRYLFARLVSSFCLTVLCFFKRRCVTRYATYCAWSVKSNQVKSASFRGPSDFSSSWHTSSLACCTVLLSRFIPAHHSVLVLSNTGISSHLQNWHLVYMGSAHIPTRYLYIYMCVRMQPFIRKGAAWVFLSLANSLHIYSWYSIFHRFWLTARHSPGMVLLAQGRDDIEECNCRLGSTNHRGPRGAAQEPIATGQYGNAPSTHQILSHLLFYVHSELTQVDRLSSFRQRPTRRSRERSERVPPPRNPSVAFPS